MLETLANMALGAAVVVAALAVVYVAFQLHLLPRPLASIAGKLFIFPMWPFTYLARRSNYYTEIDDTVILGAIPIVWMGHVSQMVSLGVRGVVNVCDEYGGPIATYKKRGIAQLHIPTDHLEPTLDDIVKAIEFIEYYKKLGARVYVHCKAGSGRSGAVAFCWLLKSTNMSLEDVQEMMCAKRRVRRKLFKQASVLAFYNTLNHPTTMASPVESV
ncbi:hypothetical protein, variant [Aphanomyces invadans]|uniref:Tyrosine specific protein phosphatases domain-containing protein n=1 Tax=Aphanomyces invadans TaxID=157072 RepID=A0A024UWD6_9STRA|nr:hypothetical protein, variant [Aphanomyces invadans]ETW10257.1 hypothetical protein, variant [Aphanomyces invadans]|eukprot:XP_008861668.1 hypothetical protein, variant [Aphanomyces invadans]